MWRSPLCLVLVWAWDFPESQVGGNGREVVMFVMTVLSFHSGFREIMHCLVPMVHPQALATIIEAIMCFPLDREETILLWFKVMAASSCLSLFLEPGKSSCIFLSFTLDLTQEKCSESKWRNDAFIFLNLRPWLYLYHVEQSLKFFLTEGYF